MGRIPLQLEDIDLEVVLDEAIASLHAAIASRNIEWRRSRLPCARADPALMRQVFFQLLSNAIKFTRTREVALIEIGSREGRADEIVIFIKDNGVGFDLRRAADLFGIFNRMHDPSLFEGLGMGLASAQRIVRRHGGTIWAEASIDGGAAFFLTLGHP
jgi:light-regulated signal transduction histidine kinase (bacteriophytochrome)